MKVSARAPYVASGALSLNRAAATTATRRAALRLRGEFNFGVVRTWRAANNGRRLVEWLSFS